MGKLLFILLMLTYYIGQCQLNDRFELIDIFDLEYVSDPQISPDGKRIIYVRNFKDIMTDQNLSNLWIVNFDGSNHRPLSTGNERHFQPRWSHDGTKIIYKSNQDGNTRIYLKWLDTGAETKLTNLPYPTGGMAWSPDDKFIAFNAFVPEKPKPFVQLPDKPDGAKWNDPPKYIDQVKYRSDGSGYTKAGYKQLFTLSASGGSPRQITFDSAHHGEPIWAKNDQSLVFTANLHEDAPYDPNNTEIYSVLLATGAVKSLTDRKGPDHSAVISPDGKSIAYLGFDDQYLGYQQAKAYIMNPDGSDAKLITAGFDRVVQNLQWSGDGKGLYFQYDDQGDTKIAYTNLSGKINDLTNNVGGLSLGRPYAGGNFTVSNTGRYAYTLGKVSHPADLGVGEKSVVKRLTRLNDDLFNYKNLGSVEEIWYESSFDSQKIQGWIVKPPDFDASKKYPLLLEIHGGPFANYGIRFSAEIQLYASAGYVVLYTNPRGSSSYGADFGNLIHHNYPNQDYDDLMSGVDAIIDKGYIDDDQLFVTGGSGGGVLSAWIVGKTDRFRAAVVAKPVINWYSFVLYSDNPGFYYKYWFPGLPWNNLEHYMNRSPISLVGNVTTPTMLLTGEDDFRTPMAETEQYYAALQLQKVESAMVRIPGASHGIAASPSNLMAKVASILKWFEQHKD